MLLTCGERGEDAVVAGEMSGKALSFLSKKSWHTSNIKNQERVWIEEQRKAAEDQKLRELQAQLEEEREVERLRALQQKSGLVSQDEVGRAKMSWMYQQGDAGAEAEQEMSAEDLLRQGANVLKKQVDEKPKEEQKDDKKSAGQDSGTRGGWDRVPEPVGPLSSSSSSSSSNFALNPNEAFRRVHEDPLFAVKKREQALREKLRSNPASLQALKTRMAEDKRSHNDDKKRKHKKKKSKKSDSSKDKKKKKKKKKKTKSSKKSRHESSPSDSSSASGSDSDSGSVSSTGSRKHSKKRNRRDRSQSPSREQSGREKAARHDSVQAAKEAEELYSHKSAAQAIAQGALTGKKYGLQLTTQKAAISQPKDVQDGEKRSLGPSAAMKRAFSDRQTALAAAQKKPQVFTKTTEPQRVSRPLTAEQKQNRLAEMTRLGKIHESASRQLAETDRAQNDAVVAKSNHDGELPQFLRDAQIGQSQTLEERLNSRRHTNQRLRDE